MLQPDMGSIFHIKNQWNILVIRNYYVNYQNDQKFNAFNLIEYFTNTDAIYSFLQILPRENWFQYVYRLCATAINFPCIITLSILYTKIDKDLKGTVVNRKIPSLQGGWLKISLTVPLKGLFIHFTKYIILFFKAFGGVILTGHTHACLSR